MKCSILVILCASLISCAVKPPDVFVFKELKQQLVIDESNNHLVLEPSPACMKAIEEPTCGYGVSIVSGKQIFVGENPETFFNNKPWSQVKEESVLLPAVESYAPLSVYIINSCKKMNCDSEVTRFRIKFDNLGSDDIKEEISGPQDKATSDK